MDQIRYIKRKELAKLLGCSPQMISKLSTQGDIPSIKVGTEHRYNPDAVISALQVKEKQKATS